MRRHFILIVALALVLYGCSAKSNTAVRPTPSAATSASSASVVAAAASPSQSPMATPNDAASDRDANLPPDTAPQVGSGVHCGTERWPVKTLSDGDAARVNFSPVAATVAQLRSRPAPGSLPQSSRIAPTELTVYSVTANVTKFKLEGDRDFHVVISDLDDPTQTMIVELADAADCSGAVGSAHASEMRGARQAFIAAYGSPSASFRNVAGTATFTGVGFFDFLHGQTGVAPNAIELHPVLSFTTGTGAVPPPPANNPPPDVQPPPPSAAGVAFISVVGARPGGVASATVQTSAGALCSISYATPTGTGSKAQGLGPKTAGSDGVISWSWNIGSRTRPGTGTATVECGAASASAAIQIG